MISVLVAEDDALTRIGLQSMMTWEKYGYTIVAVAENGQEALDLALELKPNIIITDIRMPVLDGLQLIKALKNERVDSQFIILSAYNDFEYVREALRLGAVDYLLKLDIEPDILLSSLGKAADLIPDTYVESPEQIDSIDRRLCVKKLLMGKFVSEDMISKECEALQIGLPKKNLVMISCLEESIAEPSVQLVHYPEVQTIERTIEELLREYGTSCSCVMRNQEYISVLSLNDSQTGSHFTTTRYELITKIQEYFLRSYNIRFAVQISAIMQRYQDIPNAYKAFQAIQRRSEYPSSSSEGQLACRSSLQRIRESVELANSQMVNQSFDDFLTCLGTAEVTEISVLQSLFISLVHNIDLAVQENEIIFPVWNVDEEISQVSNDCQSLKDFLAYTKRVKILCITAIEHSSINTSQSIAITAKKYVDKQYADKRLSLTELAATVNVSENYLCRLFKREFNKSPMQYLTQVRLSHAKRLLKNSHLQVKEICDQVGYANPFYFDRLFKRYTGITPTEFREK